MEHRRTGSDRHTGLAPQTLAVRTWAGRSRSHRPLNAPLYLTSQWESGTLQELAELFAGHPDDGFYARFGHPTIRLAEEKLAGLEGAADALLFSSGMGAISTALSAVLQSGDHVVAHRSIFGQTIQLLDHLSRAFRIEVDFVDATDPAQVAAALRSGTRLLYLETPSNPILDILDIEALAGLARDAGALTFVDSTFAGPLIQRPLELGADLSLQSASKSLGGHADLIAGSAAGPSTLIAKIRRMRTLRGPVLDPHACWLLLRGMQTLPLRVQAQSESAQRLARMLEERAEVEAVRYPFLASHPGSSVARRQMMLGGNMIAFSLRGGLASARRFAGGLEWISIASSLGSVYTTLEIPEELDFATTELGARAASVGVPSGLIRLSVGAEAALDIGRDILRGLETLSLDRTAHQSHPAEASNPAEVP